MRIRRSSVRPGVAILVFAALSGPSIGREAPRGPAVVPVPSAVARGVRLEVVADGLRDPVGLTFAPKDPAKRLFVAEKGGRVRILERGRVLPEPLLDIGSRVSRGSEQGLLGLAFHPEFVRNGRLFVNFTDREGDTRIVELTISDPKANRGTIGRERELLHVEQPYANHNGGNLVMAPDGSLLIGLGDGGSGGDPRGNGQNPVPLLAKMLRLDPDATGDGAKPKILAKGLRNPWRYALDRATNDLYIADVGQNAWEEVDVTPLAELSGKNFGWNILEGDHCYRSKSCSKDGLELPVVEYGHDTGCSITGGVVYRGKALPQLAGVYFYSDYCTAILRSFRWKRETGAVDHWDWKAALDPKDRLSQISAFGEDEDGEVYVLSLGGTIRRLARE